MDIHSLTEALKSPQIYPDSPSQIRIAETHISYLFFTGRYVYKVKKPVDFGFLDFTTLEKRKFFCLQEVKLNSRLSPDVYLGVEEIREENGRISLGGQGKIIEYAVKMKELPSEGMLIRLVSEGKAKPELMDRIALKIATFHREAETSNEIAGFGNVSVIKKNMQENFIQTVPYIVKTLLREQYDFISERAVAFLEHKNLIFAKRKNGGMIKDCHGDLHLGAICVEKDNIQVFDCIEFNDRFRYGDTAADIAFLTMDLEYNNRFDLSSAFTEAYIRYSGDSDISVVLRFYKSYRAYVRGKVMSFLLDEEEVSEEQKRKALISAKGYFGLAYSYFMQPTLIIMAGLVGTGKSAVAVSLGEATGAPVVRSDEARKRFAGILPGEHRYEDYEKGIYSEEFTNKTYSELLKEASEILGGGRSIILDASYKSRASRERAAALAREKGARFFIVECVCEEEVVRARLKKRMGEKEVSDGRWETYERQKHGFEQITENEGRLIRIDSARPVEENMELILKVIGR